MLTRRFRQNSHTATIILSILAGLLVICIVIYPDQAFQASLQGLHIWWKIVFPALLPFLIVSELLIGFGIVHGLGTILEPLMRYGLRLPGIAGWVLAMGFTAGYPAGAEVTATLRKEQLITQSEGERLLALSFVSSPVMIIGVVGVGFLHSAETGIIVAVIHYSSALAVAFLLSFSSIFTPAENGQRASIKQNQIHITHVKEPLLYRFLSAMQVAKARDGRTFGKLLGDSVSSSIQTLMMIGGFIMMFSVLLQVITISQLASMIQWGLYTLLHPFGIPSNLVSTILTSTFELHLGTYGISQASTDQVIWKAAFLGIALAWGGIANHAQIRSTIHQTDLRYSIFMLSRLLHAGFAIVLTFVCWQPLTRLFNQIEPSFLMFDRMENRNLHTFELWNGWNTLASSILYLGRFLFVMVVLAALIHGLRRLLSK